MKPWRVVGNSPVLMPLALLALFAGLGVWFIWPPAPPADRGTDTVFSIQRAIAHIQQIAAEPHPVGSEAHRHALDYLVGQLRALPLDVEVQGGSPDRPQLTNVLARPRHAGGGDVVLFVAHYDSVPTGPGAADDAAGVATLLETARLMAAEPHTVNEVAFLFTDGEELGMTGAGAFVKTNGPFLNHVRVVLNFEARGNAGPAVMFETGRHNLGLMRALQACPYPIATSFAQDVYARMPNDTDLTVFKAAGLTGYNFAVIMGLDAYHTPLDTWQNLDRRSLAHFGSYAATLARLLAQTDLAALTSEGDGVFFPLFGRTLVVYPASWALPLAVCGTSAFLALVIIAFTRTRLRAVRALLGTGLAIALPALMVLLSLAGLKVLRLLLDHLRAQRHYGLSQLLTVSHIIFVGVLVLLAVALLALKSWLARRLGAAEMLAGALVVWFALAVVTALRLTGFSYLMLWPAVFGALALALVTRCTPASPLATSIATLCTVVPGCLLFAPTVLLGYHALTIMTLPVFVGLATHLVLLIYTIPQPRLAREPNNPRP